MAAPGAEAFSHIADRDYMGLLDGGKAKSDVVVSFFDFGKKEVAAATGIAPASVRYDERIPDALLQRMTEWASLVNLVAQFFFGNAQKTELWFRLPNPLLGNVSPRDMIRYGRYEALRGFIYTALVENRQASGGLPGGASRPRQRLDAHGRRARKRPEGPSPALLRRLEEAPFNRLGVDKSWVSSVAEESRDYFAALRRE